MGFFGFGKKKIEDVEEEVLDQTSDSTQEDAQDIELHGPWDINDDDAPDYDEYLNMGALYLPFLLALNCV